MKMFKIRVNGNEYEVEVEEIGGKPGAAPARPAQSQPAGPVATESKRPSAPKAAAPAPQVQDGEQTIVAPMPGTILDIKASAGQKVNKGETLMILEAMKMENEIMAPHDCTVVQINAAKGASVNAGDVLIVLS